jgi:hypothetical protein
LTSLESDLRRISGVTDVRVEHSEGAPRPSEIHVIATKDRNVKQIVRDVQSLTSASLGVSIDHRIVSVVQLESHPSPEAPPAAGSPAGEPRDVNLQASDGPPAVITLDRPILENVIVVTNSAGGWVRVSLRWPDGNLTFGAVIAGDRKKVRARAAASALVKALEPALAPKKAKVEIEDVILHQVTDREAVLVHAIYSERAKSIPIVGTAYIEDDVSSAAVKALLKAANRVLA